MAKGKKTKEVENVDEIQPIETEVQVETSNTEITSEIDNVLQHEDVVTESTIETVEEVVADTVLEVEPIVEGIDEIESFEDIPEEPSVVIDAALYDIEHELYEIFSIAIKKMLVQSKALKDVNDSSRKTQVEKIISDVQSYLDSYKEKIIDLNA